MRIREWWRRILRRPLEVGFFGEPIDEPVTDAMVTAAMGTFAARAIRPAGMSDYAFYLNVRRMIGEALTERRRGTLGTQLALPEEIKREMQAIRSRREAHPSP